MAGHALLLLAFVLFGISSQADETALPLQTAINKAGRQRMLTQRIVKAYCLVGLGVSTEQSKAQLAQA